MDILLRRRNAFIFIVVAVIVTYSLFIYLQSLHEGNLSRRLVVDNKALQGLLSQSITQNIGSDLDGALQRIKGLAQGPALTIPSSGYSTQAQIRGVFSDIRNAAPFDELFLFYVGGDRVRLLDKAEGNATDIVLSPFNVTNSGKVFNAFIQKSLVEKKIEFSPGYNSDGKWRVAFTVPIFNADTGTYLGFVGVSVPTLELVERYGNVLDTSKQRLVFYDRNATLLAGYPLSKSILGHSMFSHENQMIISDEGRPLVNELFKKALSGQADTEQFDLGDGPTLVTARPIYVEGNATYFLNIPTPFSQILTPIQNLLQNEFLLNIVLLVPFTGAISYVVFMLSQWGGRLNNEVKKRTQELELANKSLISEALELEKSNKRLDNANKELEMAYENLKLNEKLQKEFVNVAAHELRTPTQSIMGFLELMEKIPENSTYYFERVKNNSARLERLTGDILDIARIESGTFELSKERIDVKLLVKNAVRDLTFKFPDKNRNRFKVIYDKEANDLFVNADKSRIAQVFSNLLSNANKFTKKGQIVISITKSNDKKEIELKVIDNGIGIHKDILPRLFDKFATKSDTGGTGIGLYISKEIVQAHGGKIWGKNNKNGIGAEFGFTIPEK